MCALEGEVRDDKDKCFRFSWIKYTCCPDFLSIAVIKHFDQKQFGGGGEKALFSLYFQVIVHH